MVKSVPHTPGAVARRWNVTLLSIITKDAEKCIIDDTMLWRKHKLNDIA